MKRFFVISTFAVFALAGCGDDKADKAINGMKGLADRMCACEKDKDPKACAEKVKADEDKFEEQLRKDWGDKEPSKDVMEKFDKHEDRFRECRNKLEEPAAPTP